MRPFFLVSKFPNIIYLKHSWNPRETFPMALISISRARPGSAAKRGVSKKKGGAPRLDRKMSAESFKKLSRKGKETYLKNFPKSSHRFLVGNMRKENQDAKETRKGQRSKKLEEIPKNKRKNGVIVDRDGRPVDGDDDSDTSNNDKTDNQFARRISKEEFDHLDPKSQQVYLQEHGAFSKKKHFAAKKPNIVDRQKRKNGATVHDGSESPRSVRERQREKAKQEEQDRKEIKASLKHGVTKESVSSAKKVTQDDAAKAAGAIESNRDHIQDTLEQEHGKKSWYKRDLEALGKIMRGEPIDPNGRGKAMTLVTLAAKYALMGSAVLAVATGSAPLAYYLAHALFENWDTLSVKAANDEDEVDTMGHLLTMIADQLKYIDVDEMREAMDGSFSRLLSPESAEASNVSQHADEAIETVFKAFTRSSAIVTRVRKQSEEDYASLEGHYVDLVRFKLAIEMSLGRLGYKNEYGYERSHDMIGAMFGKQMRDGSKELVHVIFRDAKENRKFVIHAYTEARDPIPTESFRY